MQSLERSFSVLESFRNHERLGIVRLTELTGLPKTTVHRIVRTLVRIGYLEQDEESAQYSLSAKLLSLAQTSFQGGSWRAVALAAMRKLHDATRESLYLGILSDRSVFYVDEIVSTRPVRLQSSIGMRAPIHATAAGKAIVAAMAMEDAQGLIKELAWERFTPSTLVDPAAFEAEIDRVRRTGFAVNDEEWVEDARYIAAAILDGGGKPVGAISLGAPTGRLPTEEWPRVGELVATATAQVSVALGYRAGSF